MSNQIHSIEEALSALKSSIIDNLEFYGINTPQELDEVPSAVAVTPDQLRAIAFLVEVAKANLKSPQFIAISKHGWARNTHPVTAVQACKEQTPRGVRCGPVKLYRAHHDTKMFGDGSWQYPAGFAPVLLQATIKLGGAK